MISFIIFRQIRCNYHLSSNHVFNVYSVFSHVQAKFSIRFLIFTSGVHFVSIASKNELTIYFSWTLIYLLEHFHSIDKIGPNVAQHLISSNYSGVFLMYVNRQKTLSNKAASSFPPMSIQQSLYSILLMWCVCLIWMFFSSIVARKQIKPFHASADCMN